MNTKDENKITTCYGGKIDNITGGDNFSRAYFREGRRGIHDDFPDNVILTNFDIIKGKFYIRLNFSERYIEIPVSLETINKWKEEIEKLHKIYAEEDADE